ncbi:zinc finger MYM-type protein 1-like [Rhopalosiphum padi]|uniref:zinc finger MYM-type protein 1-like n=1 Tax=Rhopalosiphum padi TaxID=40932 RepID=UPI00298E4C14|nr:zinc finger MYM-type protein 1-like [Rhopalosiphum padi]
MSENIEPEHFVGDLCDSHESSTISKATESINLTENIEPEHFVGDLCDSHESSTISKATESINLTGNSLGNSYESKFPNDPSKIPDNISHTLLHYFMEMGPCQPSPFDLLNNIYPKSLDSSGFSRSFHQSYFHKSLSNGKLVKRIWLSYSPILDKIYCTTCKLFGLSKIKKNKFVTNGSNDWKNLKRTIEVHESIPEHLQAEISRGLYIANLRLDLTLLQSVNNQVATNREIVLAVIQILIYCARQNIPLRGHDEQITSQNRGNFLELVKLIKNRLTFLSNRSQNNLLKIIGDMIRTNILDQVKKSQLFAVIIDTTTDISNQEQFSLVLRYVNDDGMIEERLAALETATDGTGMGLFHAFKNITEKYGINWREDLCAQSYDGAASMQGEYSGLRTLIQKENPRALYIWCFAHQLNLVIVDTCDCCEDTRNFFGEVQSLVAYMRARKRTAVFVNCQKELNPTERVRRLKHFSDTRWASHALKLVDSCKVKLTGMRSEEECDSIINEAKLFTRTHKLDDDLPSNFKSVRMRKIKKMPGENTQDQIPESPIERYRKNTFYKVLDHIIMSINSRFSDAREILKDLCLLSPERLLKFSKEKKPLPVDCFNYISNWVKGIDTASLRLEYIQFSSSLSELLTGLNLTTKLHGDNNKSNYNEPLNANISSDDDDEEFNDISFGEGTENAINIETILHVLSNYTLVAAFPNLYQAFKALGTIPASSASAERSFSKVILSPDDKFYNEIKET